MGEWVISIAMPLWALSTDQLLLLGPDCQLSLLHLGILNIEFGKRLLYISPLIYLFQRVYSPEGIDVSSPSRRDDIEARENVRKCPSDPP